MCDPVAIGITGLVLSGVGAVANYSMGIQQANMQASQAQAAATFQSQQAQINFNQQAQAQFAQQAQQQAQMQMQQSQFQAQQMQAMQQQGQQQLFQMQQNQAQLQQNAEFQYQNQQMQVRQQQEAQRFQAEQAAKAANLQVQQMNNQLADKYTQNKEAVRAERNQLMKKFETDKRVYQDSKETAYRQTLENATAANRVYVAEQAKLEGKRKEAAFEAQSILAKSIGAKGQILASGRTGQSVGLLLGDIERQAGFQKAQQTAMLEQDRVAALIGMDEAFEQNKAADRQAEAQIGFDPTMPYLPKMPEVPTFVGFEIPK